MVMSLVGKNRDVADPWYTGDFEKTFHDLQEALPKLLD
jgi:protein-tyrosine phosphatase